MPGTREHITVGVMGRVMKLPDFIEASKRYHKRLIITMGLIMGLLVLGLAVFVPLQPAIINHLQPRFGKDVASFVGQLPVGILIFSAFFGVIGSMLYTERTIGIVCPLCNKGLGNAPMRQVVIASKCCPHCGQRIIEEDAPRA